VGDPRNPRTFTILADSSGGAWFGYGGGIERGLGHLDSDGTLRHFTPPDGPPGSTVTEIKRDPQGIIWVATDAGVARFDGREWATLDGSTGLNPVQVWPVAFNESGVTLGTVGGGIQILSRGEERNPPPSVRLLGPVSVQGGTVRVRWRAVAYKGEVAPSRVLTRDRIDGGEWSGWGTFRDLWTDESDNLSWGRHTIEIQAKGLYGQVSEPVLAEFTIPYPLALRPIFLLPVGTMAVVLLLVVMATGRRRAQADAALRASEHRLRTLVESAPDAIAIYDVDARHFVDGNRNVLELMGVPKERFLELHVSEFLPEHQPDGTPSLPRARESLQRVLAGEELVEEWTLLAPDGREIPSEIHLVRFPSDSSPQVRISIQDIRARKKAERQQAELEEQLRQSQKLEAVGQLTGGVAHDFNNLLTVIMGNLELLQNTRKADPEVMARSGGAMEAAERSALLTQRLLAFSRRQTLDPRSVRIPAMVESLSDLLARSLGETIQVRTRFDPDVWPALADLGQLEHSLINLSVNARDAMPNGGELHIEASNVFVEPEMAEALEVAPGEFVVLAVTDTGIGMAKEVQAKAFDPFFTTKDVGEGSGLGLSMVYGFARQLGGFVKIYSEPGQGTTVRLFLPRAYEDDDGLALSDDEPTLPMGSGQHVLVVEDDPRLLELAALLCQRLGYQPLTAPDGHAGLEILKSDQSIDLLLTDVILPGGLNGVELARLAREERPQLPILYTSGYAEQSVLAEARSDPNFLVLPKPFDRSSLARKLHAALNR
jgi:PAS domain S-box-containing protein